MKNILLFIFSVFILNGCSVYTEKQSEALSRDVYATKDSLDSARIDLAQGYINQATEIVKPPKKKIIINPIYTDDDDNTTIRVHKSKNTNSIRQVHFGAGPSTSHPNKKQVLILPESYRNYRPVYVNSDEYKKLLEDKKAHEQLKWDYYNLNEQKKLTDAEVQHQKEMHDKMVSDLNRLQKDVYKLRYDVLVRDIIIGGLLLGYGLMLYLRITKPFSII